jgi:hypothetical protein
LQLHATKNEIYISLCSQAVCKSCTTYLQKICVENESGLLQLVSPVAMNGNMNDLLLSTLHQDHLIDKNDPVEQMNIRRVIMRVKSLNALLVKRIVTVMVKRSAYS